MKHPFLHALAAIGYILALYAVGMTISNYGHIDLEPFAPVIMLSVLTFSVALMAAIFFGRPVMMYIDGEKKAAVRFFIQTVAWFGAITAVVILVSAVLIVAGEG